MSVADQLRGIAASIQSGGEVRQVPVRTFLAWFGAQRRGYWIVKSVRDALEESGLVTDPDFETAYIDSDIVIKLRAADRQGGGGTTTTTSGSDCRVVEFATHAQTTTTAVTQVEVTETEPIGWVYEDPTHSISKLAAANRSPVTVSPTSTLAEAVTLMLNHDFSQLPVTTSPRDLKGIVTWASIGSRLALGKAGEQVREFMETAHELPAQSSLFQALPIIVQHNYVLIRAPDRAVVGIVTASDLSVQFQQLAEPFLLLGEVENHIRQMIGARYTPTELATARNPEDTGREVRGPADMTFGEYIRLLEDPARWQKLNLNIDRATFCSQLDQVRKVRNDVMHFDPDGIPESDKTLLSNFARFLQRLHLIDALAANNRI